MTVIPWNGFLKDPNLIGGDIEYASGPKRYGGNITRFRDYHGRITFHFTWSAAQVKRGWSRRGVKKVTLTITNRNDGVQFDGKAYYFGNNIVYLKGHGPVKEADVVAKTSYLDQSSTKVKKTIKNDEPSFL